MLLPFAALAAMPGVGPTPAVAGPIRYTVTNLGTLPGHEGNSYFVKDINASGDVYGYRQAYSDAGAGQVLSDSGRAIAP
jgi:hypothetical protein